MPNRNGTGPESKGPKTGRGMGDCEGAVKDDKSGRPRDGRGRGRGQGRGRSATSS